MQPGLEWCSISLACLQSEVLGEKLKEMSSRVVSHVRPKGVWGHESNQ